MMLIFQSVGNRSQRLAKVLIYIKPKMILRNYSLYTFPKKELNDKS